MKPNILQKMRVLAVVFLSVFSVSLFGQDINQAGDVFNQGNKAVKEENYELAIQKYEEAIGIASKLGAQGEQILNSARSSIPSLYYKMGIQDYKAKNYDKAIQEMDNAMVYGIEYNDPETVGKAKNVIPKLYYARGINEYKESDWNAAKADFSKAIELDPEFAKAYRLLAVVYSKTGQLDKMKEAFSQGLEVAEKSGDTQTAQKIKNSAKKILSAEGSTKLQSQKWAEALDLINEMLMYDPDDKDAYYYIALANNGLNNYDEAIMAAQKGLDLSADENAEYKAKFYYEMGNAYKGKGNKSEACEAYKQAKHGSFVESAEYELTTILKCN